MSEFITNQEAAKAGEKLKYKVPGDRLMISGKEFLICEKKKTGAYCEDITAGTKDNDNGK